MRRNAVWVTKISPTWFAVWRVIMVIGNPIAINELRTFAFWVSIIVNKYLFAMAPTFFCWW